MKVITQNKKATYDYHIDDRIEAGIVLTGDEVKSIRAGHIVLTGAFATIKNGELYLTNAKISPYSHAYQRSSLEETRSRKLLVHRRELIKLISDIARKGVTIVPLKVYLSTRGLIKIELGVGTHKKAASKKQAIKERDIERETRRELKNY